MKPIASPDTVFDLRATLRAAHVPALIALGSLAGLALDLARLRGVMSDGTSVALAAAVTVLLAVCVARALTHSEHDYAAHDAEARHAAGGDPD